MTLYSENNWPVFNSTVDLIRTSCQGVIWFSANDDVAWFMDRLTDWYAQNICSLVLPYNVGGQWSWAERLIRGSKTTISNHASATARDLNAAKNPRGEPIARLFSAQQITAIDNYVAGIVTAKGAPVFRWGGRYKISPVDSMHFEIMVSPADLHETRLTIETQEPDMAGMEWGDKVALTAGDAAAWNLTGPRVPAISGKSAIPWAPGDLVTVSDMIRYPTLARKIDAYNRRELPVLIAAFTELGTAFTQGMATINANLAKLAAAITPPVTPPKGSENESQ